MDPSDLQEAPASLGKAIAVRRAELGLKRKDLAARAQLSYPYVSELEKGTKEPSARALQQLADALEMSRTELMALSDKYAGVADSSPQRHVAPASVEGSAPMYHSAISTLGATPVDTDDLPAGVAVLVARLVREEFERFKRDELPKLVAAELQRTLANALQPNDQQPR